MQDDKHAVLITSGRYRNQSVKILISCGRNLDWVHLEGDNPYSISEIAASSTLTQVGPRGTFP